MKRFHMLLGVGLALAATSAAHAENGSLNQFRSPLLPVLVNVDAHGRITDVSPADTLTPDLNRLLRKNLDEMVRKPAMVNGKPSSSQFIANMALKVTPVENNKYDAQFTYVSSQPVPAGSYYWEHLDGYRLALVDQRHRNYYDHGAFQGPPPQSRSNYDNRSSFSAPSSARSNSALSVSNNNANSGSKH